MMRSVVLIHGSLTGMGHQAPCEMLAMKESTPGTSQLVFSHCSVIDAPLELPDGDYTVSFNEYVVSAKKEGGLWMPTEKAMPASSDQPPSEEQRNPFRIEETGEVLPILKKRPTDRVA